MIVVGSSSTPFSLYLSLSYACRYTDFLLFFSQIEHCYPLMLRETLQPEAEGYGWNVGASIILALIGR